MNHNRGTLIVGIGGLTSEVGKTTLLCKLLKAFPGWEAIKTTRGHYRSCGKDPHTCCVSDLLSEEPVVHSGRKTTYVAGKDTGKYWDAGAGNVHWVIATDEQVEAGIHEALGRLTAPGVLVEGNSFTEFVKPDFFVMVADSEMLKIKRTARRALSQVGAVYVSHSSAASDIESIRKFLRECDLREDVEFFEDDQVASLADYIRATLLSSSANADNHSSIRNILDSPDNKGLTQASRS
jgi:molybdopterin-guanine dinucleotide biosynthesis protein